MGSGIRMEDAKIGVVVHTDLRDWLFTPADLDRLKALGDVRMTESAEPITDDEACALLAGCAVGIGSWSTPGPTPDLLERCPDLKLWVHAAGSVRHFVSNVPEERDLVIASCAPAIAGCVAEMAVGEIIVGLKRLLENAAANRRGRAQRSESSRTVFSSTVGVVGASQVGRRVIELLKPFGCPILLYDPFVSQDEADAIGVELTRDLRHLCARSHAVTLHTPLLDSTRGMIGEAELKAMRDDAVLVNTARGRCIDEAALVEELRKGRLLAFLDVTSPEPAADDSPLRSLPNVVLTAHIAGGRDPAIGRQAVDDVAAFLSGGTPAMVVTKDMLDRVA